MHSHVDGDVLPATCPRWLWSRELPCRGLPTRVLPWARTRQHPAGAEGQQDTGTRGPPSFSWEGRAPASEKRSLFG